METERLSHYRLYLTYNRSIGETSGNPTSHIIPLIPHPMGHLNENKLDFYLFVVDNKSYSNS